MAKVNSPDVIIFYTVFMLTFHSCKANTRMDNSRYYHHKCPLTPFLTLFFFGFIIFAAFKITLTYDKSYIYDD